MLLHILVTPNIIASKPENISVFQDYGHLQVIFEDEETGEIETERGYHQILDGEPKSFTDWLKDFEYVVIGNGVPMMESFTKKSIFECNPFLK